MNKTLSGGNTNVERQAEHSSIKNLILISVELYYKNKARKKEKEGNLKYGEKVTALCKEKTVA